MINRHEITTGCVNVQDASKRALQEMWDEIGRDEISATVTPAMIEAGAAVLDDVNDGDIARTGDVALEVFTAMMMARKSS